MVVDENTSKKVDTITFHAWFMWLAWGVLGLLQIASVRYLRVFYRFNMMIHIVSGLIIGAATLIMAFVAYSFYGWD